MSNNQWLWPLCICLWAAAGRSLGSWCLRTLVWLVNFDCLVLQCKDISLRTLNTMNGGMSSITRHSYLYLWLWISLRKPLLDVTCDGEKHLLHIQVCLGTLKDTEICESKTTANSVFLFKKKTVHWRCHASLASNILFQKTWSRTHQQVLVLLQ